MAGAVVPFMAGGAASANGSSTAYTIEKNIETLKTKIAIS